MEHSTESGPPELHDDEAVVAEFLERFSSLDLDGALTLVADDWTLDMPFRGDGGPRTLRGEDATNFLRRADRILTKMDLYDVVIHGRTRTGWIAAEYKSNGTTVRGAPYRNVYVALFNVCAGRIETLREYFDPMVVAGVSAGQR